MTFWPLQWADATDHRIYSFWINSWTDDSIGFGVVITSIYQRQAYWQAKTKHALLIAAKLERSCLLDWTTYIYMLATDECRERKDDWKKVRFQYRGEKSGMPCMLAHDIVIKLDSRVTTHESDVKLSRGRPHTQKFCGHAVQKYL